MKSIFERDATFEKHPNIEVTVTHKNYHELLNRGVQNSLTVLDHSFSQIAAKNKNRKRLGGRS